MSKQEYYRLLTDVKRWNEWRLNHPAIEIDLSGEDLSELDLSHFLGEEQSANKYFVMYYEGINLKGANLRGANLEGDILLYADLKYADLRDANFKNAHLQDANLDWAQLAGADFSKVVMGGTTLANNDLSKVKGLESVRHLGPSTIGLDTLYMSGGIIPVDFLRGCGAPDEFVDYLPSLLAADEPIQFYSCFISYSYKDEDFARKLYSRLRDENIRVWFAPENLKSGQTLYEQIDRAIQLHDRLLLVLSSESIRSQWVKTEIRKARAVEVKENRRKLFPIRLVDYDTLRRWKSFDSDEGRDLAAELREFFIPDFSDWQNEAAFEIAFARLLSDLKAAQRFDVKFEETAGYVVSKNAELYKRLA